MSTELPRDLEPYLRQRLPHHRVVDVQALRADATTSEVTRKGGGYGIPLRIGLVDERTNARRDVVLHFAGADSFGHNRRSDRAGAMVLAYDTFKTMPRHARAIDVGVVDAQGRLQSLLDSGEFWLLTEWIPGRVYAEDLRRVARTGVATREDLERARALARCLVSLHVPVDEDATIVYTRAIRDLVGHGEGIFGIVDGYPKDVAGAPRARLQAIEERCVAWRWRLKDRGHRLRRTHGDFHPFNVIIGQDDEITLLDASRGGCGDPADDAACMAINFIFFALTSSRAWQDGLGPLWRSFWTTYLEGTGDAELAEVAAPFFAWRALVLAHPGWYPEVTAAAREVLLGFAERLLAAPCFSPASADELFP